mgnify:CR=1 FL=1
MHAAHGSTLRARAGASSMHANHCTGTGDMSRNEVDTFSPLELTLDNRVKAERAQSMDPMLDELERWLPVTDANRNRQRVVAPGCGLGRIVLEIARSVLLL